METTIKTEDLKSVVSDVFAEKLKEHTEAQPKSVTKEDISLEIKKELEPLQEALKKQGETLNSSVYVQSKTSHVKNLVEEYKNAFESGKGEFKTKLRTKAWDSLDTFTITSPNGTVYPSNGSNSNVASGVQSLYRQLFPGISIAPRSVANIMDFVNVVPLQENTLAKMTKTFSGNFLVTEECGLKPSLTGSYDIEESRAEVIAGTWKMSTQFMRYYPTIANDIRSHMNILLTEAIPNHVLSKLIASATAFTPAAGIEGEASPNNYDALTAMIASLEALNYIPNAIIVHPIAYRNMLALKGSDGHYALKNGMSVNVIQEGNSQIFQINGYDLSVATSTRLGQDEVIIGDMSKFNVAMGDAFSYEYYGVTTDDSDGRRNLKSFVLESDVATLLTSVDQPAIVRDTFTNVKTLITAP